MTPAGLNAAGYRCVNAFRDALRFADETPLGAADWLLDQQVKWNLGSWNMGEHGGEYELETGGNWGHI